MPVFMVERDLAGITMEQLGGAQKAAIATSEQFCMCLFEAPDLTPAKSA
jgi:hypothetical protein